MKKLIRKIKFEELVARIIFVINVMLGFASTCVRSAIGMLIVNASGNGLTLYSKGIYGCTIICIVTFIIAVYELIKIINRRRTIKELESSSKIES